ncbi:triose-phosphate isomerase [soil metagenome]
MRDFIFAANWKLHKTPAEAVAFFENFITGLAAKTPVGSVAKGPNGGVRRVVFFVPALALPAAECTVKGTAIELGGQNIHQEVKGAFTGENSAAVLKAIGVGWALVGHSERRTLFGETDEATALKMKTALDNGLSAMLCVGETLAERDANKTIEIVSRQLLVGLSKVREVLGVTPARISIAYEPVWAIGTGKVATPTQASEVHQAVRQWLVKNFDAKTANEIAILYGGSVKPDNAASIAAQPDIDGFLVGGASLEPASFLGLI